MLRRLIIVISMLFLFFLDCSAFKLFSSKFFFLCSRLQKKNFFWKKRLLTGIFECKNKIRHSAHTNVVRGNSRITLAQRTVHTLFFLFQWLQNKFTFVHSLHIEYCPRMTSPRFIVNQSRTTQFMRIFMTTRKLTC